MKKYTIHFVAFGLVTLWAVFAYAYIGVEDGSSGISPLGWVQVIFLVPGIYLFAWIKGTYSHNDLAITTVISWLLFVVLSVGAVHVVHLVRNRNNTVRSR